VTAAEGKGREVSGEIIVEANLRVPIGVRLPLSVSKASVAVYPNPPTVAARGIDAGARRLDRRNLSTRRPYLIFGTQNLQRRDTAHF